jgi:hypothetical protein
MVFGAASLLATAKAALRNAVPKPSVQWLNLYRIHFHDFLLAPPVLVFQMGKVGSQTVRISLIRSGHLRGPVYSPHFLSKEGIESALQYHLRLPTPYVPFHLKRSILLRRKFLRYKDRTSWKIISLVRDPIAREVSDFFTNAPSVHPEMYTASGRLNLCDALCCLVDTLHAFEASSDYLCTWFDKEMKTVSGIDVYDYPFDHESGYTIIDKGNISLLLLRLENLNDIFEQAARQFFRLEADFLLIRSNSSSNHPYSEIYNDLLSKIVVPKETCERIYSSRFAKHFYSLKMRQAFMEKWSRELRTSASTPRRV